MHLGIWSHRLEAGVYDDRPRRALRRHSTQADEAAGEFDLAVATGRHLRDRDRVGVHDDGQAGSCSSIMLPDGSNRNAWRAEPTPLGSRTSMPRSRSSETALSRSATWMAKC